MLINGVHTEGDRGSWDTQQVLVVQDVKAIDGVESTSGAKREMRFR